MDRQLPAETGSRDFCRLFVLSSREFHSALAQLQCESFRTERAEPEIFDRSLVADWETKKSAAIQTHEHLGAVRIGALGNHCWTGCLMTLRWLDVRLQRSVALKYENRPARPSDLWKNCLPEMLIQMVASCLQSHAMARRVLNPKVMGEGGEGDKTANRGREADDWRHGSRFRFIRSISRGMFRISLDANWGATSTLSPLCQAFSVRAAAGD